MIIDSISQMTSFYFEDADDIITILLPLFTTGQMCI